MAKKKAQKSMGRGKPPYDRTVTGQRLADALAAAGMTQSEFGRQIGRVSSVINTWVQRGIPAAESFAAARILDVNPEWLVCEECELQDPLAAFSPLATELLELYRQAPKAQRDVARMILKAKADA